MAEDVRILDYANPLGFLRATARPVSATQVVPWHRPWHVRFTEWPLGREKALSAIGFAVLCMLVLGAVTLFHLPLSWSRFQRDVITYLIYTMVWVAEGVVLGMVVARNWRQTVLDAEPGVLRLLTPAGRHEWPVEQVHELQFYLTGHARDGTPLAEIQLRVENVPTFRLFVDHPEPEIVGIVHAVREVVGMDAAEYQQRVEPPPLPTAPDAYESHRAGD